jgi:hypothetical protein
MAATEVLRYEAICGKPTDTRLVSMVAMKAPRLAVINSSFLPEPERSVFRA